MAASRCIRLASGLSGFSGLSGMSAVSRLSQQKVCRAVALPRLQSRPLLQRLGPSLLNASSAALYSTGKGDGEGSKPTSFTSAPSSGSGLADQILSAKVKTEGSAEDGSKTGGEEKQGDGGQSEEEREEERRKEASWRAMKLSFGLFGVMIAGFGGWTIAVFGAPVTDPDGNVMPDEFSDMSIVPQYLTRTWKEIKVYNKMIKDPSRDLLLPDPLQYPYMQPPYTLVLEMTGVLVHPDWTYKTGWRFKKRPGIDFFLQQVGPPLFEVVIYTAEQGFTASPIIDALDPQGYIMYRLFKDSTRYVESHHVKDLNCLNRDLSKVIMVDFNEKSVQLNPRNVLKVKKWNGDDDDRSLIDLALLLKAVASSGVSDVREVMDHYRQFDDPLEAFRENQRLLQEQEEAMHRQRAEDESKGALLRKSWTSSLLRR